MKIIITESQLEVIKKNELDEALGVPDGIYESASKIADALIDKLKTLDRSDFKTGPDPNLKEISFYLKGEFSFADLKIDTIEMNIDVQIDDKIKDPMLYGYAHRSQSKLDSDRLFLVDIERKGIVELAAKFVASKYFDVRDFVNLMLYSGDNLVSSLTHELAHAYNHYKKGGTSAKERSEYRAAIEKSSFLIPPIDSFVHNFYYIHKVENLVRPPEIAALMKASNVKADEFKNFLFKTETYNKLKKIQELSYESFIGDIKNNMDKVNALLNHINHNVDGPDEEKIERILQVLLNHISNNKFEALKDTLTSTNIDAAFGLHGKKGLYLRKYGEKLLKNVKNPVAYLKKELSDMSQTATKVIKKISKLYALAH